MYVTSLFSFYRWSSIIKSSQQIGKNQTITIKKSHYWTNYFPNGKYGNRLEIPLEGLKYGNFKVVENPPYNSDDYSPDQIISAQDILDTLEKYKKSIQKLTIDRFVFGRINYDDGEIFKSVKDFEECKTKEREYISRHQGFSRNELEAITSDNKMQICKMVQSIDYNEHEALKKLELINMKLNSVNFITKILSISF